MKSALFILLSLIVSATYSNAQGLVKEALTNRTGEAPIECGSHDLLKKMDREAPGFIEESNHMIQELGSSSAHHKGTKKSEVLTVQVVFHVLYNEDEENLHDSVIMNQLKALNDCFRRRNADTSNMRDHFNGLVGDAHIEFEMASQDPNGNPTNGIVRTQTDVTHFGGILPYGQGQTAKITQWLSDSLFDNYFRMTNPALGGSKAWDQSHYLNIWIGDMRIFEPKVNNFEEVYLMGLATPPFGHDHWKDQGFEELLKYSEGVLMHYQGIGPNNPALFENPYHIFNGNANLGKLLAHEVGHYLGLRHIWGDGDCSQDDFVHDTPRASAASNFACDSTVNTCKDTINGADLPNMMENYMDYSDGRCQNSFTKGQIAVMRGVIQNFRSPLLTARTLPVHTYMDVYPNPNHGVFKLHVPDYKGPISYKLRNIDGRIIDHATIEFDGPQELRIDGSAGVYVLEVDTMEGTWVKRLVKQ